MDSEDRVVENLGLLSTDATAVHASGTSELLVRDAFIRTETAQEADSAGGDRSIAGGAATVLNEGNSQACFIDSSVEATDRAALLAADALPALEERSNESAIYLYGSKAVVENSGCGAGVGLFSNLYAYGSSVRSAETGILSDTYGRIALGDIGDGEADAGLKAVLSDADTGARTDKGLGSVVEGGRNALVIQSASRELPEEYQGYLFARLPEEYKGRFPQEDPEKFGEYLPQELALLVATVDAHGAILQTDLALGKAIEYPEREQAYIDHIKGSVIVIKSTNADITLDGCRLLPDANGTGYLIQTVVSDDAASMLAVPDGETYPGVTVTMKDMELTGDIAHEDYQRDFALVLSGTELTGSLNQFGFSDWQDAAREEGFEVPPVDGTYAARHGLSVTLVQGSTWNVTAESRLASLVFEPGCTVNGVIYLNGVEQAGNEMSYVGDVVVKPWPQEQEHVHTWIEAERVEQTCTTDGRVVIECSVCGETRIETAPATGHSYVVVDTKPAGCEADGYTKYQCTNCGDSYTDAIPATGHNYAVVDKKDPGCEADGYTKYQCSNCGGSYADPIPATGHNYYVVDTLEPGCETEGYTEYMCAKCEDSYIDPIPATGHTWEREGGNPPSCTEDGNKGWVCTRCGASYLEQLPGTALGHDWQLTFVYGATCTEDGYDEYTCSRCGEVKIENYQPAYGHDLEYQYDVEPTCVDPGYSVWTCLNCYENFTLENAYPYGTEGDLGHSWVFSGYVNATSHFYICEYCGKYLEEAHQGNPCSVCGYS